MEHIMNFEDFLTESNAPQPSDAEIQAAAKKAAEEMVKVGLSNSGGPVSRGYFNTFVKNQGSFIINSLFDGPMKGLRDKGITPRKISKLAKELAPQMYAQLVDKKQGKDS